MTRLARALWITLSLLLLVGACVEAGPSAQGPDSTLLVALNAVDSSGGSYRESVAPQCDCYDKECGPDGCGGVCGECQDGWSCTLDGACIECTPDCEGKECGDNGCEGLCGSCPYKKYCEEFLCAEKGDFADPCEAPEQCASWICVEESQAQSVCSKKCNGDCPGGFSCQGNSPADAICVPVDCPWKFCDSECGPDECGGVCGFCLGWNVCTVHGSCVYPCEGECDDRECGKDSCGIYCGPSCGEGLKCSDAGQCVPICEDECEPFSFDCDAGWICGEGENGCWYKRSNECPESGEAVMDAEADAGSPIDAAVATDVHEDNGSRSGGGCSRGSEASSGPGVLLMLILGMLTMIGRVRSSPLRSTSFEGSPTSSRF